MQLLLDSLSQLGNGQLKQLLSLSSRSEGDDIYKAEKVVTGLGLQLR